MQIHKHNPSLIRPQEFIFGVYWSIGVVIVASIYIVFLFSIGNPVDTIDTLDIGFEAGSIFVALTMAVVISFIKLIPEIKTPLLIGLLCIVIGRTTDCSDELVTVQIGHWSAIGDGIALIGEILVVYSATQWILQAYRLSMTDKLTQLYNRHFLERAFEKLVFLKGRNNPSIALIMLDADDFKKINDQYGHGTGDEVLKIIAKLLESNTRKPDIVARLGGEEFEVLLPNTDVYTALVFAERIRKAFESHEQKLIPRFTASFGVAPYQTGDTIKSLRHRADAAVYKAKRCGKNRVELARKDSSIAKKYDSIHTAGTSDSPQRSYSDTNNSDFTKAECL